MAAVASSCPRCAALEAELKSLRATNERLERRIRDLEARLGLDSSNSSKPPSSDPPAARAHRQQRQKGKRKPGGQPGHEGRTRPWFPPEQVDRRETIRPERCGGCHRPLPERAFGELLPNSQQVIEVPQVSAEVVQYDLERGRCPGCGEVTCAEVPPEASLGAVGPRLQAVLALLTGRYRLSRREALEVIESLYGPKARLSLGTVIQYEQHTQEALEPAYAEAAAAVAAAPIIHADETSYYQKTDKYWLWVAAAATFAYFRIEADRGLKACQKLLAGFRGILVTDRWKAYGRHSLRLRQLCWAHLKRNAQGLVDRGGSARRVGKALLKATDAIYKAWHRHREGHLTLPSLRRRLAPARRALHRALRRGQSNPDPKAAAICKELMEQFDALWTFTRVEGVPPDNNLAERMIRPAVLWRKSSFGTQSERGSRFVATMLTVVQTLKVQKRSVLDYLEACILAARSGTPPPSLLKA